MSQSITKSHKRSTLGSRSGFTLPEVMIAATIGGLVVAGAMYSYIWCLSVASKSRQFSWAHTETMKSGVRILRYARNATAIDSIDGDGDWVQLVMPGGSISRFEYHNVSGSHGAGYMEFVSDVSAGSGTNIVGQGLTKVMTLPARNVFEQTGPDTLRIAYRITKPLSAGECPVEIDTGVRLRN